MTLATRELIWEILESEACEQYFIDVAERPAFLLLSKHNPLSHGGYELYMNSVAILGRFSSQKKAEERLRAVLSTAKKSMKIWKVSRWKSRKKRTLFAEVVK